MSLIVKIPNSHKVDHETPGLDQNGLVFKSPTTSIWVGSTGAGKTMAAANAIAHQAKWRKYDHIFLMSPNVEAAQKGEWSLLEYRYSVLKNFIIHIADKYFVIHTCLHFWDAAAPNNTPGSCRLL
jgi:hypothetical protein